MSELSSNPLVELAPVRQRLAPVRQRLALAEPSCLALIEVTTPAGLPDDLDERIGVRLRRALRPYDELVAMGDGRFALVLPTLAGPEALRRRMGDVFEAITDGLNRGEAHTDDTSPSAVRVALGASVRRPQDTVDGFLGRVAEAVERAKADGGRPPVIA